MRATHVAFLRGINVGGKNILPMRDLRDLFAEAGGEEVRTYIQSGNVLFRADPAIAASLPDRITAAIAARFGCRAPIILRTAAQLDDTIRHNPFLAAGVAADALHVVFLADTPDVARVRALDPDRSPPDAFAVRGQEIYLHLPHGAARTKLTNGWFDTNLATIGTGRNWRTVTKLFALMTA